MQSTIAELIAQLGEPRSDGDHMALGLLQCQARLVAKLESQIEQAEPEERNRLEASWMHEEHIAEVVSWMARAYRGQ